MVVLDSRRILTVVVTAVVLLDSVMASDSKDDYGGGGGEAGGTLLTYIAIVNLTYVDPVSGKIVHEKDDMGLYASESRLDDEWGWVVHVRTSEGTNDGCTPPVNAPPDERWIALIERGFCHFHKKIVNAAVNLNASAVVIYNNEQDHLLNMKHKVEDVVSVFIKKQSGEHIAALVDNGTRVWMHITSRLSSTTHYGTVNRSSVLFVSISFIVLMMVSLAWLVFYYVQRVRYAHSKDRLSKRLMNAAKKALNKMGQRTLHKGDKEIDPDFELCAICVESYQVSETIRILPCKHVFHKSCVDPWLIEHRTCPMCKLDILRAFGINVMGHRELTTMTNLDSSLLLYSTSGVDNYPRVIPTDTRQSSSSSSRSLANEPDYELLLDTSAQSCRSDEQGEGEMEEQEHGEGEVKELAVIHMEDREECIMMADCERCGRAGDCCCNDE